MWQAPVKVFWLGFIWREICSFTLTNLTKPALATQASCPFDDKTKTTAMGQEENVNVKIIFKLPKARGD